MDRQLIFRLLAMTKQNMPLCARVESGLHQLTGVCTQGTTSSLDEATAFIELVRPGWWWTVGVSAQGGRARIGPDYAGPKGAALKLIYDPLLYEGGFIADLERGDYGRPTCLALINCLLQSWEVETRQLDQGRPSWMNVKPFSESRRGT